MDRYVPIDCSLHDRLESAATLRSEIEIVYEQENATRATIQTRITDVYSRSDEEFIETSDGHTIRLDRLISVDDVLFRSGA